MILRPKQAALVEDIRAAFRDIDRLLLVSPTGSGKTVMFAYITSRANAMQRKVLIAAHRVELIDQISRALRTFDVPHGVIAPGFERTNHNVQVASIFTLARRLHTIEEPDLIILDEAHHAIANTWSRLLEQFQDSRVLGVTATPERMDGRGLGASVGGHFDKLIVGPDVAELIADGHLAKPKIYASPRHLNFEDVRVRGGDFANDQLQTILTRPEIVGDTVEHYNRLIPGKRCIAFCVSVAHAEAVQSNFAFHGIASESIDGTMSSEERGSKIRRFSRGDIKVLTSCDLISEGFDVPALDAVMLLRPTRSLSIYLQQVGRCLRPSEGKEFAYILDHVGNVARHGLPHEPRDWTLDGRERGQRSTELTTVTCPSCYAVWPANTSTCEDCEHSFDLAREAARSQGDGSNARQLAQTDGSLQELTPEMIEARRVQRQLELRQARTREELEALAAQRGYRRGWVDHVLNSRNRAASRDAPPPAAQAPRFPQD